MPFTYLNEAGQQISGYIDHLVETEDGPVILGHKIFPGRRDAWEAKALSYSGQLAVYGGNLIGREAETASRAERDRRYERSSEASNGNYSKANL